MDSAGPKKDMSSIAHVAVHVSQFPENVRRALSESLRSRELNHKFLYDGTKQTQKWLTLHQAYSPSRIDPDCALTYDQSFQEASRQITAPRAHLLGIGCGGGQKDTRFLRTLQNSNKEVFYTPCDVSVAMVLVARQSALSAISPSACFPFVCDLATTGELAGPLHEAWEYHSPMAAHKLDELDRPSTPPRLVTFFGMLPNFEPQAAMHKLASLIRSGDFMLLSANLAPGEDYLAGMKHILPQYDNMLTRDWLFGFLLDLGVEPADGELRFELEDGPGGDALKRITAYFHFDRHCSIDVDSETFEFRRGESLRVFFSYRHTCESIRSLLSRHGLRVCNQWLIGSGEEGIFLVSKI